MPKHIITKDSVEYFFNRIKKTKDCGDCWLWSAYRDKDGYGKYTFKGERYQAHRFMWFLLTEEWPQDCVLHKCDNPPCVNPNHLFEGSTYDNIHDSIRKGRFNRGETCARSKLVTGDILLIRKLYQLGMSQACLGRMFDVTVENIGAIIKRRTWRYV
jgi:hypothetical protein